MTPCERVRAVYRGQRPDQVPLMLDLSHWYKRTYRIPFDLAGFKGVDQGLVALHREMRGALRRMAACGVDCIDAATPSPMFSLSTKEAREEAGDGLILSGGIPATVFGGTGSEREFTRAVRGWLETRRRSSRLIIAAGDQVPPDAPRERIESLHRIVDRYGRY